jgi:hypothetical protein
MKCPAIRRIFCFLSLPLSHLYLEITVDSFYCYFIHRHGCLLKNVVDPWKNKISSIICGEARFMGGCGCDASKGVSLFLLNYERYS